MIENKQTVDSGFDELGIKDTILASIKKLGFTDPTPIQAKTIPIGLSGQDLIGIAQTGTGKTFAFGIPMLQRLGVIGGRGLILLPTRELALQVEDNLKKLGTSLGLKTATFIGGEAQERQLYALRKNPHIIIATPGRLIDFLKRKILTLNDIKILVLDEADMMFDLGFAPQVEEILTKMPTDRQTMLFSATMPLSIVKLTTNHMKLPVSIEAAPSGTTAELVDQEMYIMHKDDRIKHLEEVLNQYKGSVLVFVRTKHSVSGLTEAIRNFGHTAEEIHSNLSLRNRRKALDDFKSGKARVLVATDIAARGLDVNGIELVINYNLPDKLTDYVHRIGRTGRAGKSGKAISFATPDQARDIRDIERIINQPINLTKFAEPQAFGSRGKSSSYSRGKGGAKPSRFTSKPGFERNSRAGSYNQPKPEFGSEKYTPSLSNPVKAPYKKFDQAPSGYVAKDTFERDQRMNHLPRFNNKPDFSTFKFVEDAPTPRAPRREESKPRTYSKPAYGDKKPFSKTEGAPVRHSTYEGSNPRASKQGYAGEARPARLDSSKPSFARSSSYEGSKPRTFGDKPAYSEKRSFGSSDSKPRSYGGEKRVSSYEGSKPRTFGDKPAYSEKRSFGDKKPFSNDANRASSYHSGRPSSAKPYASGPSSYKSSTTSSYEGSKPRTASAARPTKSGYGAKSDSRPAKPFRAKSKPGFRKPR
jgi:ATP-dependent RNA helicase RhlE